MSFTLTMAASRCDQRRELVVREAEAIGTTRLRAAILEPPYQQKFEQLLRCYQGPLYRLKAEIQPK